MIQFDQLYNIDHYIFLLKLLPFVLVLNYRIFQERNQSRTESSTKNFLIAPLIYLDFLIAKHPSEKNVCQIAHLNFSGSGFQLPDLIKPHSNRLKSPLWLLFLSLLVYTPQKSSLNLLVDLKTRSASTVSIIFPALKYFLNHNHLLCASFKSESQE